MPPRMESSAREEREQQGTNNLFAPPDPPTDTCLETNQICSTSNEPNNNPKQATDGINDLLTECSADQGTNKVLPPQGGSNVDNCLSPDNGSGTKVAHHSVLTTSQTGTNKASFPQDATADDQVGTNIPNITPIDQSDSEFNN